MGFVRNGAIITNTNWVNVSFEPFWTLEFSVLVVRECQKRLPIANRFFP